MATYDSNWHSTTAGETFLTDGVVTTQKYYVNYGAHLVTFDNVALLMQPQNTPAMRP